MIDRPRPDAAAEEKPTAADLVELLERELEVEAILGEKRVPLCDLSSTAVGHDLLLLPKGQPVRLVVGAIEIGEGTTVEVEGRLALRIDQLRPVEELAAELGGLLRSEAPPEESKTGAAVDTAEPNERLPLQSRVDRG